MNPIIFLIPIIVGIAAQVSKAFLNKNWLTESKIHGRHLPRYGGMPSAHTAFAFSLATLAALAEGIGSMSFAIASALVILLLDDALRMRVYLSRHGEALAQLIKSQPPSAQQKFPPLERRLGHSLPEVVVGALVGIGLTIALFWLLGGRA
ncbi:MAG: divergent PAP2 family protein [Candidatus Andersenbacteria bacterium]|nr:divergent PAP2 family protein [Candidatus Andersenbacteria bacterium]MBI3250724.1 divergent PAP2 family protein [Candidatus Andersenbacteria bacterium]